MSKEQILSSDGIPLEISLKKADNIRKELLDKGVLIEDKDGKTIWKIK